MNRFYLAAILAGLAVGCGDGGSIANQPPGAPEGPARFTGVDADGSLVGALPEGAPIRTPENYHPVDQVFADEDEDFPGIPGIPGIPGGDDGPSPGGPGGGGGVAEMCQDICDGVQACVDVCVLACSQDPAGCDV